MSRRLISRSLALVALVGAAATAAAPTATAQSPGAAATSLGATLDSILGDARLTDSQSGVVVIDTNTGQTLYNRNANRRMLPASNTKLLTSTAAMDVLGPDYRFTTEVRGSGRRTGPLLGGDLYLRGTGDPTMLAADYDALATQVAKTGVRIVQGDLIADDTWFDSRRLGSDWAWDDESSYYAAQVSALTVAPDTDYDAGNVIVNVAPGAKAGAKPVVTLTPSTGYVTIDNQAKTVASGDSTISVDRPHGTNRIVITGQVAPGADTDKEWIPVWEPTGYAADVFRRALARHGVRVLGGTTLGRATPASGTTALASHQSMTLAQLLVPFLKLSNNGHAEVLTKAMGREVSGSGSWSAGLAAIGAHDRAAGVDTSTLRQVDGSGLSRQDLVPPAQIANVLLAARKAPWFQTWYNALPIAGNAERFVGGTLSSRMAGTPAANNVHAKTGSLTGVSALSGYATSTDGHVLVFSAVFNAFVASSTKDIEDQIAVTLASYSTSAGTASAKAARPSVPAAPAGPEGLECSWVKPIAC